MRRPRSRRLLLTDVTRRPRYRRRLGRLADGAGRVAALGCLAVVTVTAGAGQPAGSGQPSSTPAPVNLSDTAPVAFAGADAPNPFAGTVVYVDPASSAAQAAATEPDPERARQLHRVASGGHAQWIGDWFPTSTVRRSVDQRVTRIGAAGALPVLVVYNIPQRDCGGYSGGGAHGAAAYRAWIDQVAAGIGSRTTAVILEPDSLADIDCLSDADQQTRYELLTYAVNRFNGYPAIATYLDGGHSGWQPTTVMAQRLRRAHVSDARGFALNVSNFRTTTAEIAYGRALSSLIGGKRFVVDTGRNGLGPISGAGAWCNPAGRALGPKPLTPVADPLVDALLWVKVPGQSDGACGRGEPAAGTFWTDYAIGLASRAAW